MKSNLSMCRHNSLSAIRDVTLTIPVAKLRHWDEATHGWQLEQGVAEVMVGASSAELPLHAQVTL